MPEIKKYDGKKKQTAKPLAKQKAKSKLKLKPKPKRRPHREVAAEQTTFEVAATEVNLMEVAASQVKTVEIEMPKENSSEEVVIQAEASSSSSKETSYEQSSFFEQDSSTEREKLQLHFFGSEILRHKAPKVMELADTVVDEWVHDGTFEGLPVGNPLAQVVASKALRKVKDVEKKLEEKGVFMLARVGIEYVKAEINKRKK